MVEEENKNVLLGKGMVSLSAILMVGMLCVSLVGMHVAFAICLAGCLLSRPSFFRLPGFWFGVAFAAWQIIGAIIVTCVQDHNALWHRGHGAAFTWLAGFVFVIAFADVSVRKWALRVCFVAVIASISLSLLQFIIGHGGDRPWRVSPSGERYYSSSGFMPLSLSQSFIIAQMSLLFSLGYNETRVSFWLKVSGWLTCTIGVHLANSRAGILGFISATTVFYLSARATWKRYLYAAFIIIALITGAIGWMHSRPVSKIDAILYVKDSRWTIYHVASEIIRTKPWFGTGPNGGYSRESDIVLKRLYPNGSQDRLLATPDAHNIILGLASEHGIPALILFSLLLISIMRHLYRRRTQNLFGWRLGCGATSALLVAGQFENYVGHSATSYAFFTVLGMAMALDRVYLEDIGIIPKSISQSSSQPLPDIPPT